MSREPQTIVWLPTLHRLIATETGKFIFELIRITGFFFQYDMKRDVTHVKHILLLECGKKNDLIKE